MPHTRKEEGYSDLGSALNAAYLLSAATHQVRYVVDDRPFKGARYRVEADETLEAGQVIEATVHAYDAEPWKRNRKV